jgi:hypothetical protein
MFNNIALDAVIGLSLIYLLYSLLISILGEFISTKIGLRARILRTAIERMLNDDYLKKAVNKKLPRDLNAWRAGWMQRNLLQESPYFKHSFAGRFYNYPSIKFLARIDQRQKIMFALTKPSYISPENFADTLIQMLKEQSQGQGDLERIIYTLQYNMQHIQPQTLKNIRNLFNNANGDLNAFRRSLMAWYNETNDRATGWFKRKLTFILLITGLFIASLLNIDSIQIAQLLLKDKLAREQLVNMGITLSKDTSKYKAPFKSTQDSLRGKNVVDTSLAYVSRDINAANLILGAGWRYDTLYTIDQHELQPDDPHYRYALDQADRFNKAHSNFVNLQKAFLQEKKILDITKDSISLANFDLQILTGSKNNQDIAVPNKKLAKLVRTRDSLLNLVERDSLYTKILFKTVVSLQRPLLTTDLFWISHIEKGSSANGKKQKIVITGKEKYDYGQKLTYYFVNTRDHFWGLLLTAFALSLGAPFWFNLLSKLVSIRASGPKPDNEANDPSTNGNGDGNNADKPNGTSGPSEVNDDPTPDPAVQALDELTNILKNENGIVSLSLDIAGHTLTIAVKDADSLSYIEKKYTTVYQTKNDYKIPLIYEIQTPGRSFGAAFSGYGIKNPNGPNGNGTLGAYLAKEGSNTAYFISCWHVMKENRSWNDAIPDEFKGLIGDDNKPVGTVLFGALTPTYDAGIAITTLPKDSKLNQSANGDHKIQSQHRALTAFDEQTSTNVRIIARGENNIKLAKIFRINVNPTLPYGDGNSYTMHGAFSLINPDNSGCPTIEGDSGAIVIDDNGAPVGMIYGGNDKFAYAIKFTNLLHKNKPFTGYSFILPH